jgi:hypothetical protein
MKSLTNSIEKSSPLSVRIEPFIDLRTTVSLERFAFWRIMKDTMRYCIITRDTLPLRKNIPPQKPGAMEADYSL